MEEKTKLKIEENEDINYNQKSYEIPIE